jgi:hypothetical protein
MNMQNQFNKMSVFNVKHCKQEKIKELQIQGHSRPWIFVFKFKDIQGLSSFVRTLSKHLWLNFNVEWAFWVVEWTLHLRCPVFSIIIIIAGCISKIGVCVQKFQVKAKFQPFFRFSVKSNLHASYKFKTDLDFFLLPTLNFCNNMLLLLEVITLTFNIILICIGLV